MRTFFNLSSSRPGPSKILKFLLLMGAGISILTAISEKIFPHLLRTPGLFTYLSLSSTGVAHYSFWQFITYLFVNPAASMGLSFSLLLSVAFNAYLMWIIGKAITERRGLGSFLRFFFLSGLLAGLSIFGLEMLFASPVTFGGSSMIINMMLIGWIMLNSELELLLFLAIPLKAKWLAVGLLASSLFVDISVGNWLGAGICASSTLISYLYCITVWKCTSPFRALRLFENFLISLTSLGETDTVSTSAFSKAKIYDIKTGRAILSDEEFLDVMLSKISMNGKNSLTFGERFRLKRISKRKKQKSAL